MWFSDGARIPANVSPLPQNERLGYIQRLKEECAKLMLTETPAYLVYMGRLLQPAQKTLLESLQNEIANLAVIDYDEVENNIFDPKLLTKVQQLQSAYKKQQKLAIGVGGIASLVDLTRLILLYNSHILKSMAQAKITTPLKWGDGLIYRDFDVTLERETMTDIPTTLGCIATLNFTLKVEEQHASSLAKKKKNLTAIDAFFNQYLYNLDAYKSILVLFSNKPLSTEEETLKTSILSQYQTISTSVFDNIFVFSIMIENSFIAVHQAEDPLIADMIKKSLGNESSYAALQSSFHNALSDHFDSLGLKIHKTDLIKEFLTPQQCGFKIGNDLTWRMTVAKQHARTSAHVSSVDSTATNAMRFTSKMGQSQTKMRTGSLEIENKDKDPNKKGPSTH